jgi:hypothetical protein
MQPRAAKPIQIQGVDLLSGAIPTPRSNAKLSTEATLCRLTGMARTSEVSRVSGRYMIGRTGLVLGI